MNEIVRITATFFCLGIAIGCLLSLTLAMFVVPDHE